MTLDELLADRAAGLRHLIHGMGFTPDHATHLYELLVNEHHHNSGGLMEGPPLELRSNEGERRAPQGLGWSLPRRDASGHPTQLPGLPTPPGQAGTWPWRRVAVAAPGPRAHTWRFA